MRFLRARTPLYILTINPRNGKIQFRGFEIKVIMIPGYPDPYQGSFLLYGMIFRRKIPENPDHT